jgi:nucleoside-diphosphate-sugar epimerase
LRPRGVEILPPLQDYFDCIDELAKTNLEWSVVLNGIFLDYFSAPPIKSYLAPNAFVIDMANNTAAIPGTGDEMVTFTHTFDVAKFLVAALDLAKWPRELRISGDEMTFKDFVKLAEEIKGRSIPPTSTEDD